MYEVPEVEGMDEVELTTGRSDLQRVLDLATVVFPASRQAATARRLARRCPPLADVAVGLTATDEAARIVGSIRLAATAATRRADACAGEARVASLALAPAIRVQAQPSSAGARSARVRAVRDAAVRTERALGEVRRHGAVVGRLAAGLAARHPGA